MEGAEAALVCPGMDVVAFCKQSRVLVVAGKGGVGKTTTCAALARAGAQAGLDVLVIELEGRRGLPAAFSSDDRLHYTETVLAASGEALDGAFSGGQVGAGSRSGAVKARWITPDDALLEYLGEHGLQRISKRLVSSGALDVVSTAVPGIKDILVLGKVKQLERAAAADLIIVDAPATGHAFTFLSSARGLLDAVRAGPVRSQAAEVTELLTDPARCRVLLVTLPEEMPINEAVESANRLEHDLGMSLAAVVVNGVYPELDWLDLDPTVLAATAGMVLEPGEAEALREAARFRLARQQLQSSEMARLAEQLPLPQLPLPALFATDVGVAELQRLASALALGIETLVVQ